MTISIPSEESLPQAAKAFIDAIGDRRVFAFLAPMGTGKTTFIAEVCRQLGVTETANSPSFSIINEYIDRDGEKIYHFDFYRFEDVSEGEEIGAEDYFYSGRLCLIEWPERIEPLLPEDTVVVRMNVNPDGSRTLTMD